MKRNKKGRPSKSDLAAAPPTEKELRRSGRRRNVRYTFDFDDYLDDEEYFFVEEEEDERRREKKIKLLLKLHSAAATTDSPSIRRHEMLSLASSLSGSDEEEDDDKVSKKLTMINGEIDDDENEVGSGKGNSDEEDNEENVDNNCDGINEDDDEVKGEKMEVDYAPGGGFSSEYPLPDKKSLELILHKLQKKDIYGVYAEPVDPEELPDYHDLIKNPMDFKTIRSKLSNGSYVTLEQFESDVFLLCSNAMQYNEPDTIYHKQARSIQDLAKRKFQKLRVDNERSENQTKSEQKPKPVSVFKKHIQRQTSRALQEPIGSDIQNGSNVRQASVLEKAGNLDVLVEGNHFVIDTSVDKLGESIAGRGPLPRYGKKAPAQDENRATYSMGSRPNASSDSAFSTFDEETKQLIPVGLHVEHAYARSLSRFAGTLGRVAWRVASKRIEQILPPGTKFGRGWVGEFEPLPTPVLIPDNCNIESDFIAKPQHAVNPGKHEMFSKPVASGDSCISALPLEGKLQFANPALSEVTTSSSENSFREPSIKRFSLDGKSSFSCSKGTISGSSIALSLQPTHQLSNLVESSKNVVKPVELLGPSTANHNSAQVGMERWVYNKAEAPMPNSAEVISVNRSPLPSTSFKQSNTNGVEFGSLPINNPLLNGAAVNCTAVGSKEPFLCPEMNKVGPYISHGQELALSDPVQLMKRLTEKNKDQQYPPASQSAFSCPPGPSVAQSLNRQNSCNAAAGVDRSWMSMGSGGLRPAVDNMGLQRNQIPAESLYNATLAQQSQFSRFRGDFPAPMVYFQPGNNNYPFHGAMQQPVRAGSALQFHNQPMVLPQMSPSDLSRLQAQSPWRNLSPPAQQAQKQGSCPPDLNVSFQSTGSPGRPSPGVVVDSRQPDLALQL